MSGGLFDRILSTISAGIDKQMSREFVSTNCWIWFVHCVNTCLRFFFFKNEVKRCIYDSLCLKDSCCTSFINHNIITVIILIPKV